MAMIWRSFCTGFGIASTTDTATTRPRAPDSMRASLPANTDAAEAMIVGCSTSLDTLGVSNCT